MSFAVLDWRRKVHAIYSAVRLEPDPARGHAFWVEQRDQLLKTHPASPVPRAIRESYAGADVADYDPQLRYTVSVTPPESPDVRDERTLIALYERIGHTAGGEHRYDTAAAQDTGRQVRFELIG